MVLKGGGRWLPATRERMHKTFDRYYLPQEETIYIPGRMKLDPTTGRAVHEDAMHSKVIHHIAKKDRLYTTKMISLDEVIPKVKKTVTKKTKKAPKTICQAVTLSGKPCGFKAINGCYCGRHAKS